MKLAQFMLLIFTGLLFVFAGCSSEAPTDSGAIPNIPPGEKSFDNSEDGLPVPSAPRRR